jgi:Type IV secretion system pilin
VKKLILVALVLISLCGTALVSSSKANAIEVYDCSSIAKSKQATCFAVCDKAPSSPLCKESQNQEDGVLGKSGILTRVVKVLIFLTTIASVIVIIVAGIKYITSQGDSGAVSGAKNSILYAVIGLVIALVAQLIVSFVLNR